MTMTLYRYIAVAAFAVGLAGCTVAELDNSFDDALIDDVGAGSQALNRFYGALDPDRAKPPIDFRDDGTAARLFRGQLHELTVDDLEATIAASRGNERQFRVVLSEIRVAERRLRHARVDSSAHRELSDGAHEFIQAWNRFLFANASRARQLRRGLARFIPWFDSYEELASAAQQAITSGATAQVDRLRDETLREVGAGVASFNRLMDRIGEGAADRRIRDLVNNDQEANAIVQRVNEVHPDGYLAKVME